MANKHYTTEHEFEVTLKLKVKITNLSNYFPIKPEDMQETLKHIESELRNDLPHEICKEYIHKENVSQIVDYVTYDVEEIK